MKRLRFSLLLVLLLGTGAADAAVFDPSPHLGARRYGVYLFDERVGSGSFTLEESEYRGEPAHRTELRVEYRVNLGGQPQKVTIREEKIYLPETGLAAFTAVQESILGRTEFIGQRDGEIFRVETPTGEREAETAGERLADALAHLELVRKGPEPGDSATARIFETTLLAPVKAVHTVEEIEERFPGGVSLKIYRVRSDFPELGISTSSLIDGDLRTLEGSMGIVTIREEGEEETPGPARPGDLLLSAAVRPDRPLPRPREIDSLRLKLSGIEESSADLSGPGQAYEKAGEDTYYLTVSVPPLPPNPPPIPLAGPDFAGHLEATAYIQSDHRAIRERARRIAGEEKDSLKAARLLTGWVYTNLEKSFLAAIPNAVDVLERLSGDCKAHSVLLVALARSLGLPARTVSGLVAMEDGLFYYHQWAELYVGGWIPVDPVFGQLPADAARVVLSRGGPAEQLRLLNLVGRISIEVVEWGVGSGQ